MYSLDLFSEQLLCFVNVIQVKSASVDQKYLKFHMILKLFMIFTATTTFYIYDSIFYGITEIPVN